MVKERHRHRYEFNNAYRERFEKADFVFSGLTPDGKLVEIIELPKHPFFIASQFHPEFRSKPHQPHPLFKGFIAAAHARIAPEAAVDREGRMLPEFNLEPPSPAPGKPLSPGEEKLLAEMLSRRLEPEERNRPERLVLQRLKERKPELEQLLQEISEALDVRGPLLPLLPPQLQSLSRSSHD